MEGWRLALNEEQFQIARRDLDDLARRIDSESRLAILNIKRALWQHPQYRKNITSRSVYEAVLEAGVRDLEEFVSWQEQRGITV